MPDAFVRLGRRTPRGKAGKKGALAGIPPLELVTTLLREMPADVDDLVLGCATQVDEQGTNIARTAAVRINLAVPGATVNRFCASGLDAINLAAAKIRAGDAGDVLAGGVESVSRVPMLADRGPLYDRPDVMGLAADKIAAREGFTREQLDDFAFLTREKARRAPRSPSILATNGLDHDELVDFAPTREELAALPPAFGGLHSRASSPALADAACLVHLSSSPSRIRIVATATTAADPELMLTAGQDAVQAVLGKAGLAAKDVHVFCFAEAFAATCLRFMRDLEVGHDRLNPDGGTIARGHAFGATGAILLLEAVEWLDRREARYAVVGVSGAAGVGSATLIERL